jgi:Bacterial EndoU nuclease
MAVDGPDDDGVYDRPPGRQLRSRSSDAGAVGVGAEPAETRTRAEYYETLRGADQETAHVDSDRRHTEYSGWAAIDADNRPDLDELHIPPERLRHILDGDRNGGGHRHGTGKPGKTEFPASWDDGKVAEVLVDVARRPDLTPGHQEWSGRWVTRGTRDDVEVVVIVAPDGRIWSGWPLPGGAGVIKNPEGG